MPNIALKRDAPFRGGFVFYQALGLRLASVSGTPLSFTLSGAKA
jgi:hypothetical protein